MLQVAQFMDEYILYVNQWRADEVWVDAQQAGWG
jgi:hypothetical protein